MDITDVKKLLINDFGTPPEYDYLVVPTYNPSGYVTLEEGKLKVRIVEHKVIKDVSGYAVSYATHYGVFHNLKLVVFSSEVFSERNYE